MWCRNAPTKMRLYTFVVVEKASIHHNRLPPVFAHQYYHRTIIGACACSVQTFAMHLWSYKNLNQSDHWEVTGNRFMQPHTLLVCDLAFIIIIRARDEHHHCSSCIATPRATQQLSCTCDSLPRIWLLRISKACDYTLTLGHTLFSQVQNVPLCWMPLISMTLIIAETDS